MNFFLPIYQRKLALMQAAAPRATLRCLHDADGFHLFLSEAAQAGKLGIGRLENKADDPLMDEPVLQLFVPFDQMQRFIEAATSSHSVALIDVMSADRVHAARHVVYAYFPRRPQGNVEEKFIAGMGHVTILSDYKNPLQEVIDEGLAHMAAQAVKRYEEKQSSADFWG